MQSRVLFIAILLSVFALPAAPPHLHADARPAQTLTALVGPHSLTRDTNGDEVLVWANFADSALTTPCTAGVTKIRLADAKQLARFIK